MSSNVSEQSKEENPGGKRIKNISKRRKFRSFSLGKWISILACLNYILDYTLIEISDKIFSFTLNLIQELLVLDTY